MPKYKVIDAGNPGNLAEQLNSAENAEYELATDIYNYSNRLVVILVRRDNAPEGAA
jgi:hypothetical protein